MALEPQIARLPQPAPLFADELKEALELALGDSNG